MNLKLYMPVTLFTGKNCVSENAPVFSSLGKKCLIVTGGKSAEVSGALGDVENTLKSVNIEYEIFNKITPNPLASVCIEGGSEARKIGADFIVGIGGGSALDASKAVAICAENPDYDINGLYTREIPSKALPLVLVGTTSGTGSEVTGVSVLTNDNTGMKKSISGADCYAKYSFLDPKYTFSMNLSSTVSTALDALAHSVEGYFSNKSSGFTDAYAIKAIPLIYKNLKAISDGKECTEEMHEELYYASIYAGLVINTCGCAFEHTVGYILTENFGIPHGRACTAFTEYFIEKAKKYKSEKYNELFGILGVSEKEYVEVIKKLTDVKISATDEQIDKWCSRWNGVKNFDNTPGGFTNEEAVFCLKKLRG